MGEFGTGKLMGAMHFNVLCHMGSLDWGRFLGVYGKGAENVLLAKVYSIILGSTSGYILNPQINLVVPRSVRRKSYHHCKIC